MSTAIVETITPPGTMTPIGPYSHVAKANGFITIGAVAGVDPKTGGLAGEGIDAQTHAIFDGLEIMLAAAGSGLQSVMLVNVYLLDMADFAAMNAVYAERMGAHRPARTAIGVAALPKPGARLTISLMAAAT